MFLLGVIHPFFEFTLKKSQIIPLIHHSNLLLHFRHGASLISTCLSFPVPVIILQILIGCYGSYPYRSVYPSFDLCCLTQGYYKSMRYEFRHDEISWKIGCLVRQDRCCPQ